MKITSKGQVTIPVRVREKLGLYPDTEVEWEVDGDAARLRPKAEQPLRGWDLVRHMRGRGTSGMTTDEIMQLTRGED